MGLQLVNCGLQCRQTDKQGFLYVDYNADILISMVSFMALTGRCADVGNRGQCIRHL